jgi:flagellar biosynthesis protein FliR
MFYGASVADLVLFVLVSIRTGVALRLIPFWGSGLLPVVGWIGLSIVIAGVSVPFCEPFATIPDLSEFVALAIKEVFVGVLVGSLVRIVFSIFEVVGDLSRISALTIPGGENANGTGSAPLTQAYVFLGSALFLLVGGHHAFITGFVGTMRSQPPTILPGLSTFSLGAAQAAIGLLSAAIGTAVLVAAPIFIAGLLADVIIGVASRIVKDSFAMTGTQVLRAVFVQLMIISTLGFVVSVAIRFVESNLIKMVL